MPTLVIVGAQWGDEGKGRITDLLCRDAHMVVRYQGGANAGHTVVVEGQKYILHLIPSGIVHPGTTCVIGNGMVIDLPTLFEEMDALKSRGLPVDENLVISERAQVTMPYHRLLDQPRQTEQAKRRLVTTNRGIRPTYVDKIARMGIRVCDLFHRDILAERLAANVHEKSRWFEFSRETDEWVEELVEEYLGWAEKIRPYVRDTSALINQAIDAGKNILFEGAQGTGLDVDFGTYPYVTSSNTTAGGACTGTGVGPSRIDRVIAVAKAYTTRVGDERPFPTLMEPELEEEIRQKGNEFGATTGRPRRCGWYDAVLARHTAMVNGLHSLVITKIDVLDAVDRIKICVAYRCGDSEFTTFPADLTVLEACEPVYEEMPGWQTRTSDAKTFDELPRAAQRYIQRLGEVSGCPVSIVSVGESRNDVIMLDASLATYAF